MRQLNSHDCNLVNKYEKSDRTFEHNTNPPVPVGSCELWYFNIRYMLYLMKFTNLKYSFVTEKEIGGFEISVNDPVVMEMSHTLQQLNH